MLSKLLAYSMSKTDASFNRVERFRLLVIGNSGVGKSSLINECFSVRDATVAHSEAGVSDINTSIIASENGRLILHDSQGFEHGEGDNFKKVVDFLKARKDMPNVRDQVHAVWLCFQVSISEGDRMFEAGVEELFRMKARGELGPVPVITVFTKYDRLVTQVKFGNSNEFMRRTKTLDADARNALLVEEANKRFETLSVRPFRAVVGPDVPYISVSIRNEYINTLKDLTALTAKCVKECLGVDVAKEVAELFAVAQHVNPPPSEEERLPRETKHFWKTKTQKVLDQEVSQSNIEMKAPNQEMSQSNMTAQPAQFVDLERQKIPAKNLRRRTRCFRVLIIGQANAGKTTILQRVCNTTEQPKIFDPQGCKIDLSDLNPTAKRGEHNIENEMIFDSNPGYVFHDSRGFESGRTAELDIVKSFIQHRSTAKCMGEQLHAIWYCIPMNDEARPITRAELSFFDECGTGRVPVIVLFTKADVLDAQTTGRLVESGMSIENAASKAGEESIINFHQIFGHMLYAKKYPPKTHIYFREMQHPTSDCSALIKETAAVLSDDAILQLFLSVQQNHLSLSMKFAVERVMFDHQGQWSKNAEKMTTIKNMLKYFPHIGDDLDGVADDLRHDDGLGVGLGGLLGFSIKCFIPEHDALHCIDWSSLGDNKTFKRSALLCIATVIIAELSYFIWKQRPSKSSEPLKISFSTFQSAAALKNIQKSIEKLDRKDTEVAAAIVKIALDNRLAQ